MATILLDGERLTLADLERVARQGEAVANRTSRTNRPPESPLEIRVKKV